MPKPIPNVGDTVIHSITRNYGKVMGYGHQLVEGVYQTTLRVNVSTQSSISQFTVVEDLASKWNVAPKMSSSQVAT